MDSDYIRMTQTQFFEKMYPMLKETDFDEVGGLLQPSIINALGIKIYFSTNSLDYFIDVVDERKYMMTKLKHGI